MSIYIAHRRRKTSNARSDYLERCFANCVVLLQNNEGFRE